MYLKLLGGSREFILHRDYVSLFRANPQYLKSLKRHHPPTFDEESLDLRMTLSMGSTKTKTEKKNTGSGICRPTILHLRVRAI